MYIQYNLQMYDQFFMQHLNDYNINHTNKWVKINLLLYYCPYVESNNAIDF